MLCSLYLLIHFSTSKMPKQYQILKFYLQEAERASLKQLLYPCIPTLESSHCNGWLHTIVKNFWKNHSCKLGFYLFNLQDMSLSGTFGTVYQ